jgi:hypothetical protein
MKKPNPQIYRKVKIEFLSAVDDCELEAEVSCSPGRMSLSIIGGDGPYLIVGAACEHWFSGRNLDREGTQNVWARWTAIEGEWVGIWIEEGTRYLISFRLPKVPV